MADYVDLTTVRQHLDESGRLSAEMVLGRIADSLGIFSAYGIVALLLIGVFAIVALAGRPRAQTQ